MTIFISPNMPLDDDGNMIAQVPEAAGGPTTENGAGSMAPPGYGQHLLDQLYEDMDLSGIMTPVGVHSASEVESPSYFSMSRSGSHEDLSHILVRGAVPPAALSSRLQDVSLDSARRRRSSLIRPGLDFETMTIFPHQDGPDTAVSSRPLSPDLPAPPGEEGHVQHSGPTTPPEHVDLSNLQQLNKVPSYTTATRSPMPRTRSYLGAAPLPDYQTATSAQPSPAPTTREDPFSTISVSS